MSLEALDQQIEAVRARAKSLQKTIGDDQKAIENNPNLSPEGRKADLAEMKEAARSRMASIRAEENKLATDRRDSLRRTVMGTVGYDSSSIISYRDAQDRAAKLADRDDAARVMERALTSGDKALASAVAEVALDRGYRDVYNSYASANPAIAEAAKDLAVMEHYFTSGGMARALAYMV
ncbi:hypothetical protein NVV95_11160 [Herbiconiux sp. CPCC 205716]|uniref:Uncharacterized protein n=1 Tax=Herbiconiux gentiana TaxID=2970912 RepID=A0ABT2GIL4_9MICO|nr:hypothetical protein [Herbiconiux gentiana]MCS5715110.1 hypothetical protein [Herbiconiux gentiana]